MSIASRERADQKDIDVRRVRVFSVITSGGLLLFLVYRFLKGHMPLFFVILTAFLTAGTGLVLSILKKSPRATAHLTLIGASLSAGGTQIQDGRIESTALWVISVIPFVAGHLLGKRAIASYSVLAGLLIAFSMWGESLGFVAPVQISPTVFSWINLRVLSLVAMTAVSIQMAQDNRARIYKAARKILESEQAHRQALEHDKEKALFLTQMSDEIRSPMNGIKGISQYWSTIADGPEPRSSVEVIDRCADRLMSMLQDIQDISKIEQGEIQIFDEPFLVNLVISDISRLFQARASAKGLTLEVQGPTQAHWVRGDAQRLVQVLANLVGNAIKFSDTGKVLIRWAAKEDQRYSFEVIDQGIGMTQEQLDHLFERYHQVNLDQGVLRGGSGLGLTISLALSQAMQGELVAQSEHEKGSTFTLTLRLPGCAAVAPPKPEQEQEQSAPKNLSVLMVESEETSSIVLQLNLESLGCKSIRFTNTSQAIEAMRTQPFDLLILDLESLREPESLLVEQIRRDCEPNRATPILKTSARSSGQARQQHQDLGFVDLLVKPITPSALARSVQSLVRAPAVPPKEAA